MCKLHISNNIAITDKYDKLNILLFISYIIIDKKYYNIICI